MPIVQPNGAIRTVYNSALRDVKFSPDGSTIYVANGTAILVFDPATGAQITQYQLGQTVGAIDLSPDGSTLVAVIQTAAGAAARFDLVDTANGIVTPFDFALNGNVSGSFFDIAYSANNQVLISQLGNGPLIEFDFNQSSAHYHGSFGGYVRLTSGADHDQILIMSGNLLDSAGIFTTGVGITYSVVVPYDPYAGASVPTPVYASGTLSSVTDTFAMGVGMVFRNTNGSLVQHLPLPYLNSDASLAYSPAGDRLYALQNTGEVLVIDVVSGQPIAIYPVGGISGSPLLAYGDLLQVSPDGRFLSVVTTSGLQLIDLSIAVPISTTGDDVISEYTMPIGLAGNDTLDSLANWSMYGGAGNDRYVVDSLYDGPVELAGEGRDTILLGSGYSYFAYALPLNIEDVVITSSSGKTVTGFSESNSMTGAAGNDTFYGQGGTDTLVGNGGNDQLYGGDGDDLLQGGTENDVLDGGNDNDQLSDDAGTNVLLGGAGADILNASGAAGSTLASYYYGLTNQDAFADADSLTGSGGSDVFYAGFNDTVIGNGGIDLLNLNLQGAAAGVTLDLRLPATGGTIANGSGQITGVVTNILSGSNLADAITTYFAAGDANFWLLRFDGMGGDDTITGSGGDEWLSGGTGSDTLIGAGGSDHLYAQDNTSGSGWGGDNTLNVDRLEGGDGNDFLDAGTGDTVLGGTGFDRLFLNLAAGTTGVTLSPADIAGDVGISVLGGQIAQIEAIDGILLPNYVNTVSLVGQTVAMNGFVLGGETIDTLTGSEFTDWFIAGFGDDVLDGRGGDDALDGGDGLDLLIGGEGHDSLSGGADNDTVSYAYSLSGMSISLASGVASNGASDVDQLISIEYVVGSNFSDTILGFGQFSFYSFNRLYGADGNDTLDSNANFGLFDGGAGDDTIILRSNASGSDVVGGDGFDRLVVTNNLGPNAIAGIELLEVQDGAYFILNGTQFSQAMTSLTTLAGSGTVSVYLTEGEYFFASSLTTDPGTTLRFEVYGTEQGDVIKSVLGVANAVNGYGGADQIRGGELVDTIDAGAGNDKIMGLGGADQLTGGAGADQFRYLFTSDSGLGVNADRILDFTNGEDRLDFRVLDADPVAPGRQTLSFVGTSAFTVNGTAQLRYADSGTDTLIQIDLNGDGAADMEIVLAGHAGQALAGTDFLF